MNRKKSVKELASDFNVGISTIRIWIKKYQSLGSGCFNPKTHIARYTKEFKQQVVEDYLAGKGSLENIAIKYVIPSSKTDRNWILKYNNLEILKGYDPKLEVYMKDCSRKTT